MGVTILLYVFLLLPEGRFEPPLGAGQRPFVWNQDASWRALEREFVQAKQTDPMVVSNRLNALFNDARNTFDALKSQTAPPGATAFLNLETNLFMVAPLVGVLPERTPEFGALVNEARSVAKRHSETWNLGEARAREQLYRIVFGGRMALEMVMVQLNQKTAPSPMCSEEPSATPSIDVADVRFHSGDIFVSRGTKATSSLISRGNDLPGNFSHIALLHVDERTGEGTIIEALIEKGVITVPFREFFEENRLRLMLLRMRADLPALRADPLLPHRAASLALRAAQERHTPYDFTMDFGDHRSMFCSEVASRAYEDAGVRLWMGMSHISSATLTAWLGSLGVRHFETQEPSDLEYDPQLRVIAEWRNATNLFLAHLNDAVTDVLLETAPPGAPLDYSLLMLPLARCAKLYSMALNAFGKVGPVPEGMSATVALRAKHFEKQHDLLKVKLAKSAVEFRAREGYTPPYWELLDLARHARP